MALHGGGLAAGGGGRGQLTHLPNNFNDSESIFGKGAEQNHRTLKCSQIMSTQFFKHAAPLSDDTAIHTDKNISYSSYYRGSPDSTNFVPPGNRTIAKIVLSGDLFSTKNVNSALQICKAPFFHNFLYTEVILV